MGQQSSGREMVLEKRDQTKSRPPHTYQSLSTLPLWVGKAAKHLRQVLCPGFVLQVAFSDLAWDVCGGCREPQKQRERGYQFLGLLGPL